ncbi:hypothetical protein ABPG77_010004 [Micractinium sp. CCAP 211/92]
MACRPASSACPGPPFPMPVQVESPGDDPCEGLFAMARAVADAAPPDPGAVLPADLCVSAPCPALDEEREALWDQEEEGWEEEASGASPAPLAPLPGWKTASPIARALANARRGQELGVRIPMSLVRSLGKRKMQALLKLVGMDGEVYNTSVPAMATALQRLHFAHS